jgi:magnesium-transporting ATPase (P-type)
MNQYANQGLRTLMFGVKVLDSSLTKESAMAAKEDDLESNIELLGVTGLEDMLQDNVASCVEDFRKSGIKVWMLTGDKGETAHTIGVSCGMIDPQNHTVVKVEGNDATILLS